jgi:hypothetical protein
MYFDDGKMPTQIAKETGLTRGQVTGFIGREKDAKRSLSPEEERAKAQTAWRTKLTRSRPRTTPTWQCKTPRCRGTAQLTGYCAACITAALPKHQELF